MGLGVGGGALMSKSAGPLRATPAYVQVVVALAVPTPADAGSVHSHVHFREELILWFGNDLRAPLG
ncbi:MAG: hypothetical protein M3R57_08330 [Chloroflexota bacterium]|nr:hypothetical protein [Chloroflexota bacterium]